MGPMSTPIGGGRSTPRVKEKHYAPLPTGFVMTAHKPSKPVYSLLGDVTTEITFELPSTRFEIIKGRLFGKAFTVVGLTVCTPRDGDRPISSRCSIGRAGCSSSGRSSWLWARPSSRDDRKIVELQREGLKFNPESDADPGFRPARHLVPPGQEGLGGIGRNRHGIRQSCAGTDAALAKLISRRLANSGVASLRCAQPSRRSP